MNKNYIDNAELKNRNSPYLTAATAILGKSMSIMDTHETILNESLSQIEDRVGIAHTIEGVGFAICKQIEKINGPLKQREIDGIMKELFGTEKRGVSIFKGDERYTEPLHKKLQEVYEYAKQQGLNPDDVWNEIVKDALHYAQTSKDFDPYRLHNEKGGLLTFSYTEGRLNMDKVDINLAVITGAVHKIAPNGYVERNIEMLQQAIEQIDIAQKKDDRALESFVFGLYAYLDKSGIAVCEGPIETLLDDIKFGYGDDAHHVGLHVFSRLISEQTDAEIRQRDNSMIYRTGELEDSHSVSVDIEKQSQLTADEKLIFAELYVQAWEEIVAIGMIHYQYDGEYPTYTDGNEKRLNLEPLYDADGSLKEVSPKTKEELQSLFVEAGRTFDTDSSNYYFLSKNEIAEAQEKQEALKNQIGEEIDTSVLDELDKIDFEF